MALKIEKGIPVIHALKSRVGNSADLRGFYKNAKVGDSVITPVSVSEISRYACAAREWLGHHFTSSPTKDGNRVWRIK